jgi:hypothetical protein
VTVRRWWQRLRREPDESSVIDVELMRAWIDVSPTPADKPASLPTPGPMKTRLAREALVAVLTKAGGPLTRSQVLQRALADPKIEAAGVSESTLSAQLTAAVAEEPPRILRIGRGVYAASGLVPVAQPGAGDASASYRLAQPCG